jgi:hypothetical protein
MLAANDGADQVIAASPVADLDPSAVADAS